ncbi:MAG: hypothetical protein JW818_03975 [Pirellulales bacterium]|nr:hypothetical protein [Pirellulales bacterium]
MSSLAVFLVICLVVADRAAAQETTTDKTVTAMEARAKLFLETVSMGKSQTAYDALLAGSPLLIQSEALRGQVAATDRLESLYGPYKGFERIAARRVGTDLILLRYLYKCERFPVVWHFAFYHTPPSTGAPEDNGTWRVIIVRFDTKLESLLP